jgi:hypothetical protein
MRRLLSLLLFLLATGAAFAADRGTARLDGFYLTHRDSPPSPSGRGYGASLDYWWSPRLSTILAMSSEPAVTTRLMRSASGVVPETRFVRLHPVDVAIRYHAGNWWRLQPYAGAGVRYVRSGSLNEYRPLLNAGVILALTRHLSVDADWKRLYNQHQAHVTSLGFVPVRDGDFSEGRKARFSLGLGWTL